MCSFTGAYFLLELKGCGWVPPTFQYGNILVYSSWGIFGHSWSTAKYADFKMNMKACAFYRLSCTFEAWLSYPWFLPGCRPGCLQRVYFPEIELGMVSNLPSSEPQVSTCCYSITIAQEEEYSVFRVASAINATTLRSLLAPFLVLLLSS